MYTLTRVKTSPVTAPRSVEEPSSVPWTKSEPHPRGWLPETFP